MVSPQALFGEVPKQPFHLTNSGLPPLACAQYVLVKAAQGVRVGLDNTTLDGRGNDGDLRLGGGQLVGGQRVGGVEVLVDDAGHGVLAVGTGGLGAVVPDGVAVLHNDLEDVGRLARRDGHKATEEGGIDSGIGDAGGAEAGLGHRVVLGQEVPLDDIAGVGDHVVRVEDELTGQAGDHRVRHTGQGHGAAGVLVGGRGGRGRDADDSGSHNGGGGKGLGEEHSDYQEGGDGGCEESGVNQVNNDEADERLLVKRCSCCCCVMLNDDDDTKSRMHLPEITALYILICSTMEFHMMAL